MNRQQALDEIAKSLGVLAHQVQQENLSGMYSKNRLIEDVFLPLFRILFSSPDLKNINTTGSNTAHLDLANSSFG
ncbi:MAG: SMEK domain-containing protein, partial [Bryobacteraceae bacterium]